MYDRLGNVRLLAHLKPDTGALFLVLPLRCVNSPLVGLSRFESLLTGLGGEFLLPARQTPKLIFHTLRYKSREGGSESAGAVSDWESRIRSHAASVMDKETSDFFTQCSPDVVPGRFSLRLPPSLCQ